MTDETLQYDMIDKPSDLDPNLLTQAWLKNKLDLDKGLFSLSGGMLGLIVFLMSFVRMSSTLTLVFYIVAVLCFLMSLSLSIFIYKGNSNFIEKLKNDVRTADELLPVLDKVCLISFMVGIIFVVLIGVFTGCQNIQLHATL